jgi:hypothetical protein
VLVVGGMPGLAGVEGRVCSEVGYLYMLGCKKGTRDICGGLVGALRVGSLVAKCGRSALRTCWGKSSWDEGSTKS